MKLIYIVGPPAAGKTTVRNSLADYCHRAGLACRSLSIEDSLRAVCVPNINADGYSINSSGALEIQDRVRIISSAWDNFSRQLNFPTDEIVIAEFADKKPLHRFLQLGRDLIRGSLIVHIDAPLNLRLRRNRGRRALRMPDHVVRSYPPITKQEIAALIAIGAKVLSLDGRKPFAANKSMMIMLFHDWMNKTV